MTNKKKPRKLENADLSKIPKVTDMSYRRARDEFKKDHKSGRAVLKHIEDFVLKNHPRKKQD